MTPEQKATAAYLVITRGVSQKDVAIAMDLGEATVSRCIDEHERLYGLKTDGRSS